MVIDNRKPNWLFYPAWVVASAVSIPLAAAIGFAILSLVIKVVGDTIQVGGQTHITEDFLFVYILAPILGLVSGLLQYFLLRHYLPRMVWWIAATVLGWLLFSAVGIPTLFSATVSPALAPVLIGGLVGLTQWFVLRQRVRRAALWILASVLGWGLPFLLISAVISSQWGALTIMLLPPIIPSIAWWLLLDKLPQRESKGSTPRNTSLPLGAQ